MSQITYPSGRQVLVVRNANGQVTDVKTKQTSASAAVNVATGISWKPLSQLVAGLTHGNGLATNASYNTDYRLTQLQLVNGAATVSGYAYSYTDGINLSRDNKGDVSAYADPRNITTTYARNGYGEVIQENSPDAGTTSYVRDERGLVTKKTDGRGVVTNMEHDAAGRLTRAIYPTFSSENVDYFYDGTGYGSKGKGRLSKLRDESGSTEFIYNALGQVLTERRTIGGRLYLVNYVYNKSGKVTQITYPSGRIVDVSFNSNRKAMAVTTKKTASAAAESIASSIGYKPMSDLVFTLTHGNGLVTSANYDLDYRLTRLQLANGSSIISRYVYSYGDGMNLTGITDQVTAANSNALSYSPANRLASATGAWGTSSYSYDSVGNRLTDVTGSITNASLFAADSNRITGMTQNAAALRTYSYDGAGNITQDVRAGAEVFDYTYNRRNRLASVTRNGQPYGSYVYNALEQLVARNTGTAPGGPVGTVHYIYDRDGHLIAEIDGATGSTLREYIWLPSNDNSNDTPAEDMGLAANDNSPADMPLAVIDVTGATTTTSFIHTDHLGRPIRMTNAGRATVWAASYKPWGEVQSITGTVANTLRFPGQYFQIETSLAYNWHRHYDPVTGRYTQPDPLGLAPGMNRYAYADNSPFMVTDRDGQCPWCVAGVIGGLVDAVSQYAIKGCVNWHQVAFATVSSAVGVGILQKFAKIAVGNPLRPTYRLPGWNNKGFRPEMHPIRRWLPNWASYPHWHLPSTGKWHLPLIEPIVGTISSAYNYLSNDCGC